MSATATQKTTLEEFQSNPDIHYYDFNELHNGEIVVVPNPSIEHVDMQVRLEELLRSVLGPNYLIQREFYLSLPENSRRVDVAALRRSRWHSGQKSKSFLGSPELVTEVLSPSNTCLDADQLRDACFREGGLQFWLVNMELQTVLVFKRDRSVQFYDRAAEPIPLEELTPGAALALDAIFT